MVTVRHGPIQSLVQALGVLERTCPGFTATLALGRSCPECGQHWDRVHPNQLFCSTACRTVFNRRCATRGRSLLPFAMVARITRDGTRGHAEAKSTGKRASGDANQLLQRWRDEDAGAGRMNWIDFLAARYRAGFEPL